MARFAHGAEHATRRTPVKSAIDRLDTTDVQIVAFERTLARLSGGPLDLVADVAGVVPTEVLALSLGIDPHPLRDLIADIEHVVGVIGRGEAASRASDAATRRLLARFGSHPSGAVEVVSMLYQNFDATRFMIAATVHAIAIGAVAPVAPVPRTRRVCVRTTAIDGLVIEAGATVSVEIGAVGLPFGAGAHECPGRFVAEAIVRGATEALRTAGYAADLDDLAVDADGRPTSLSIRGGGGDRACGPSSVG